MALEDETLLVRTFLVEAFPDDPDVERSFGERGRFGGRGLRVRGKTFAMPVGAGLTIKLPRDRIDALVASGIGERLRMGSRQMTEWLVIADRADWEQLAGEALSARRAWLHPRPGIRCR